MNQIPDETILAAMISCGSATAAARMIGADEKTIRRRMKEPELAEALREARSDMLKAATADLRSAIGESTQTIREIMLNADAPSQTRLNAAQAILGNYLKLSEQTDILDRLDRLESGT